MKKGSLPKREQREERREKRADRGKHDHNYLVEGRNGSVPEWRDGIEKGRPLREKRAERREEREERDKHDQDERV